MILGVSWVSVLVRWTQAPPGLSLALLAVVPGQPRPAGGNCAESQRTLFLFCFVFF